MQPVKVLVILSCLLATGLGSASQEISRPDLVGEFEDPSESFKPWTFWFFYNDHISKEGIDADLAAMKKVGIGTALLFTHVSLGGNTGEVKGLSEAWWELVKYAIRRAGEEGIDIGLFNGFGWSQSGGPWNSNEQTMRHLLAPEIQASGPGRISQALPSPEGFFQDVRLLAFPTPAEDDIRIRATDAFLTSIPDTSGVEKLFDGDTSTVFRFPETALSKGDSMVIDIRTDRPFKARSLRMYPSGDQFLVDCKLLYKNSQGVYEKIREFRFQRPPDGVIMDIGPFHDGPASISFPAHESDHYRLVFKNFGYHLFFGRSGSQPGFREIELSAAYRLDHYIEKLQSKVWPLPFLQWNTYLWDRSNQADDPDLVVASDQVIDISQYLENGILTWEVPEGDWTILRVCMVPTGAINTPVLPEAEGPEIDKLTRELVFHHFESFAGKLTREIPAPERKSMKYLVIDSYEKGYQNWTDDLEVPFREAYGYDPIPYLPVFSGRAVGSPEKSERFMWDLRRLVADRVSFEYVGGLREISHQYGLKLWVENYGHWGYPGEMLQYGGQADIVSGEFWVGGFGTFEPLGSVEVRAAASAAHTYGKTIVCAESFTSNPPHYISHPWALKLRGDWSFCEGVNLTLLAEYLHQPYSDRVPGVNAAFGTAFNRNNIWFFDMDSWILYEKRCNLMLQQGLYVADLAYFIGEDAPKVAGITDPKPPPGYAYDLINGDVIRENLAAENGRLTLPDGMSYKLLVLPPLDNMRPELLEKIRDMVRAGGSIYGPPPTHSPSLENHPDADEKVRHLAGQLWQECDGENITSVNFGKGKVFWGMPLDRVLEVLDTPPDIVLDGHPEINWIHRSTGTADIYFLSNQSDRTERINPVFRLKGKQPECWDAVNGSVWQTALFEATREGIRVPLELAPRASVFVVFREAPATEDHLVQVTLDGEKAIPKTLLDGGNIRLLIRQNGKYSLHTGNGRIKTIVVRDIPEPIQVKGPWDISFAPGLGAPASTRMDSLIDWAKAKDPGIRYHSGKAVYNKELELPGSLFSDDCQIILDLGNVGNIAGVKVNGKTFGNFWNFPMEINVTGAVRRGKNDLEITVTNTWHNRLMGDIKYPEQARTWLVTELFYKNPDWLVPSGLMGPVQLKAEKSIKLTK
jgi:hypothetical protein